MLWYKAWRESRTRFLIAAFVLIGMCLAFVLFQNTFRAEIGVKTYVGYIHKLVYGGSARGLFLIFALVLGLGGLNKERALNTESFTLALPVSRLRLVTVRAVVGLLETAILSALPPLLIPDFSRFVHESYPFSQALQFGLLWIGCGAVVFAAAFLSSTVLAGDYSALTVAFLALMFYPPAVRFTALKRYPLDIHYIMNGNKMPYFDSRTDLFIGPFPWTILLVLIVVTFGLLALAARITQEQEF
jgi:ABC-2 type transport system permease protein